MNQYDYDQWMRNVIKQKGIKKPIDFFLSDVDSSEYNIRYFGFVGTDSQNGNIYPWIIIKENVIDGTRRYMAGGNGYPSAWAIKGTLPFTYISSFIEFNQKYIIQHMDECTVKFDAVNFSQVMIDLEHHSIHRGTHYTCQDYDDDVDVATAKYWHIKAPNTDIRIHMVFKTIFKASGLLQMFETPTLTNDGTALTAYNNSRNSANTTTLLIYQDPTVSDDGSTRILVNKIGSGKSVGGAEIRNNEIILKKNTSYIIKCTTDANDNQISNCLEYYEV